MSTKNAGAELIAVLLCAGLTYLAFYTPLTHWDMLDFVSKLSSIALAVFTSLTLFHCGGSFLAGK